MKIYQVDAFTDEVFTGNPAAVCPLDNWIDDRLMQQIATENNLSDTAFFVKETPGEYSIRWFTPVAEVNLCGHATLASAHVLFEHLQFKGDIIEFHSKSGPLTVVMQNGLLCMDFPAQAPVPTAIPQQLAQGLGIFPKEVLRHDDYMAVFGSAADIETLTPDFSVLRHIETRGIIATAPGDDCDFVSRFFAPGLGIEEDPVTGSTHRELAPYWANRLRQTRLTARQLSTRGGYIECEIQNDRVLISGRAKTYLIGDIFVA